MNNININNKLIHFLTKILPFVVIIGATIFATTIVFTRLISKNTKASTDHTYFVSSTGSDTNSGTIDLPFKTISTGLSRALPGDTIRIMPGTYRENIMIIGKNGTADKPIRIVGDTTNPAAYPVIDGGDAAFTSTTKNPALTVSNSSWLTFEKLKIINSTDTGIRLDNGSHHIVLRRDIFDYHSSGIILKANSNHILVEYCEFFQSYPEGTTWTQLKASKWEGGAFKSDGGSGMNIIRYNYFHHQFNGVFLTSGYKPETYYDANVWIYRNRFEDIVDDPYEPETWAFNNHFFENTLINTHRMVSFAPGSSLLGPVYVYNNFQYLSKDPTGEAATGRINSAFKVDLSSKFYTKGIYLFNNSVDMSAAGTNGYGIDMLNSTINNFTHVNNVYSVLKTGSSKSSLTLVNSTLNSDLSKTSFGYIEPNGYSNIDPKFLFPSGEDLRPIADSLVKGKSQQVTAPLGFASIVVIPQGADLGAFQIGENDFRKTPSPVYVAPPSGESTLFAANTDWPADIEPGSNPLSGPLWLQTGTPVIPTVVSTGTPISTPTIVSTIAPSLVPTKSAISPTAPIPSSTPVVGLPTSSTSLYPTEDAYVDYVYTTKNYGSVASLQVEGSPAKLIYLKFDFSSLVGSTINKAVLRLFITDTSTNTQTLYNVANTTWSEKLITYNTRPTSTAISIAKIKGGKAGKWVEIDITSTVKAKLGGLATFMMTSKGTDGFDFYSKEASVEANRPVIVITK